MWRGIVLAILLLPATARAQEVEELRLLPEFTPCTVAGVRYACYTAESQARLNALELLTQGLQRQLRSSETLRLTADALVLNMQAQLVERNSIIELTAAQVTQLTAQLMTEIEAKNRFRAEAERGPDLWPIILGVVVGVLGLGLGAGLAISAL